MAQRAIRPNAGTRVEHIINNPTRRSSQRRYQFSVKQYEDMLIEAGVNLTKPYYSGLNRPSDAVTVGWALTMPRCGPKSDGFDERKALATGGAVKSAVVNYWSKKGYGGDYVELQGGGYTGNLSKSPRLQVLIIYRDDSKGAARTHLTRRAYQQTHEDVVKLYYRFVTSTISRAIRKDYPLKYSRLQAAVANILQFNAVARGYDILSLKVRDLLFTGDSLDEPIIGVLPVTKKKKRSYTYFNFSKQIDISICCLSVLQGWVFVLRAHGVDEGNLFLHVTSNSLQGGKSLDGTPYARFLRDMGAEVGMPGLAEHSGRMGSAGYHYFVQRWDLFFIYRAFSWESLTEMMKYVGLEDVYNSYALLGFTAFDTNELFFPSGAA